MVEAKGKNDKQWSTKQYIENYRSNTSTTQNRGWT